MTSIGFKRCVVAYATAERQYLWTVDLPREATVADAIEAARRVACLPDVPWDSAPVGIFGELTQRSACPRDADRIELYRPLREDPREQRRDKVRRQRRIGLK